MDAGRRVDLTRFIEELDKFSEDEIPRIVDQVVRKEAFDICRELVLATPVGNPELWANPDSAPEGYVGGHARRNWQVTANAPSEVELPGVDASGDQAIADADAALANLDKFPLVFITNNVPYMDGDDAKYLTLNQGHSSQTVAGFIEGIVDRHAEQFRFDDANAEQGGPE